MQQQRCWVTKLKQPALAVTCLMLLCGCDKEAVVIVSSAPFCRAVRPVCVSQDDKFTEGTAKRLLSNEYGRETVCGAPPKCPREPREPQIKPTS